MYHQSFHRTCFSVPYYMAQMLTFAEYCLHSYLLNHNLYKTISDFAFQSTIFNLFNLLAVEFKKEQINIIK